MISVAFRFVTPGRERGFWREEWEWPVVLAFKWGNEEPACCAQIYHAASLSLRFNQRKLSASAKLNISAGCSQACFQDCFSSNEDPSVWGFYRFVIQLPFLLSWDFLCAHESHPVTLLPFLVSQLFLLLSFFIECYLAEAASDFDLPGARKPSLTHVFSAKVQVMKVTTCVWKKKRFTVYCQHVIARCSH